MKKDKKLSISSKTFLDVKKLIKCAKEKQLIKPHTEAFVKNPVEVEVHRGKINYFNN